jgi:hypothetical protein
MTSHAKIREMCKQIQDAMQASIEVGSLPKSPTKEARRAYWQLKLECAIQVYVAVEDAREFAPDNEDILRTASHPCVRADLLCVDYAELLNKDLVAEMAARARAKNSPTQDALTAQTTETIKTI